MLFTVLFFVCGIIEIMGRPNIRSENISNDNIAQIPPWPLTTNTFLLPRPLKVGDIINVTIVITSSPIFSISLISQNGSANNTTTICKLVVDKENKIISIFRGDEEEFLHEEDLHHFIHEENETTFNISFKRREAPEHIRNIHHDDGFGVLQIHNKFVYKAFGFKHLDNLRLLQFTGENFRVSKLGFDFV